jgi:hypothetical protein
MTPASCKYLRKVALGSVVATIWQIIIEIKTEGEWCRQLTKSLLSFVLEHGQFPMAGFNIVADNVTGTVIAAHLEVAIIRG